MKRVSLLIVALIYAIGTLSAQVSYELRAPGAVSAGERFRIEFVITNSQVEKFNPPTFTGLEILAGPVSSHGKFFSDVNGKVTEATTVTYTYTVQATSGSRSTISSSSVVIAGGKTLSTKAAQIEIGQAAAANNGNGAATGQQPITSSSILLRMEVNKTDVYKGEAIVASLKIYTQVGIAGFDNAKIPAFNGFWKQELDMATPRPQRATVNGKVYESQVLKQWLVYPQRTGTLEIEQCDITAVAQVITQASGSSLFDNFFGNGSTVEHVRRNIFTPPVKIRVKELPQPQPTDFSGGVGKFTLSGEISTHQVTANSGGSITIKLSGTGDLPLVDAPIIELPNGFEKYDTKSSDQISNTVNGSSGTRTWEIPFIARAEGDYSIPGITMSYFDPATGKYNTLTTGNFAVKVLKDTNPGSNIGNIVSGVTKEDLKILGQDIRYIRSGDIGLHKRGKHFLWSAGFFISLGVIIGVFILLLILLKKQIKNRQDIARTKNKKANSVALRRLKKAKGLMNSGNKSGFYEEILRALWGYMGDKLTITVSDLSKERLRDEFAKRGVSMENGEEFLNLISECEMAQYSPSGSIDMNKAYDDALDLIGKLELK